MPVLCFFLCFQFVCNFKIGGGDKNSEKRWVGKRRSVVTEGVEENRGYNWSWGVQSVGKV